jgi:parallel beta-helix repeat protein
MWFLAVVFWLATPGAAQGRIIYVDTNAPGSNDGSSWADAYNYLQDALADVNSNPDVNQIRVAHGIYTPDCNSAAPEGTGDREATFQLIDGVTLKGGYAGFGQPDHNVRNVGLYETILSGDLDGNDVDLSDPCDLLTEPTRAENSYHVVTGSGTDETAVLDGFTITAGNANGQGYPIYQNYGAGMYNSGYPDPNPSSPTLNNCTFRNNVAGGSGGGICNRWDCSPRLTDCIFIGNSANQGGGMSNSYNCNSTLINCIFIGNSARNDGSYGGGGMFVHDSGQTLINCLFLGNSAFYGAGMDCSDTREMNLTNCVFSGNSADYGGGMRSKNTCRTINLYNCSFSKNSANYLGGGIYNRDYGTTRRMKLINCILWGNNDSSSLGEFSQIRPSDYELSVSYCDIQGGWEGIGNIDVDPLFVDPCNGDYHLLPGSPCIDAGDPNYLAEPNETDLDGNPRVVDGDNDGNSVVDMGAYEHRIIYVDTDANGADDGTSWTDAFNYLQDALAAAGSGAQIWVAEGIYTPDCNSAVPDGTGDREATFQLIDGVTLKGGYAGFGQPYPNACDPNLYETVLSGDLDGNDLDVNDPWDLLDHPSRAENSYHVVTGSGTDETAILDGFTISGGNKEYYPGGAGMYNMWGSPTLVRCTFRANSVSDSEGNEGAGLYNRYGSPTLTDCKFIKNAADDDAAGMYSRDGSPTLTNCLFSGNDREGLFIGGNSTSTVTDCTFSGNKGKGMGVGRGAYDVSVHNCTFIANLKKDGCGGGMGTGSDSRPMVVDCVFVGNSASDDGGGMFNYGNPTLINCIFIENRAGDDGGAIKNVYNNSTLINCIFIGNRASGNAGGIQNHASRLTQTDCIFIANTASGDGGAVHYTSDSDATLTNCIFSGNSAVSAGGGIHTRNSSAPTLTNCTFAGNSAANGSAVSCDSYEQSHPSNLRLTNCILWDGGNEIWNNDGSTITITYSDVQGAWPGQGNIEADPCFADPGYWDPNGTPGDANDDYWVAGDYHLKSEGGRWDPNSESWVLDDVTSACIDKGDWSSPIGDEPYPNGGRVNMGAYGGTGEASKSPVITCWEAGECAGQRYGDANCDGVPSLGDLFALKAYFGKGAPWTDPECCADFNHDDSVNLGDLFILKANFGSGPYSPSTGNQNCPP